MVKFKKWHNVHSTYVQWCTLIIIHYQCIQSTQETLNFHRPRPISRHDAMHRVCTLQCCGQLNPLMEADLDSQLQTMETIGNICYIVDKIYETDGETDGEIQDRQMALLALSLNIRFLNIPWRGAEATEVTEVLPNLLGSNRLSPCRKWWESVRRVSPKCAQEPFKMHKW